MPRYSGKDDRRSIPYDSSKDRSSRHHKDEFLELDDKRLKRREWNQDRTNYSRDHGNSSRNYRGRSKYEDHGRPRNYEFGRHHNYDKDREKHHRQRSPSRSDDESHKQSRSLSNSPSRPRSKRTTGFDMAPQYTAPLLGVSEQLKGFPLAPEAVSGMFHSMFTSETTQVNQLGYSPLLPIQAMSQQATRHARRVYVGGLPPLANEQTIAKFFSFIMTAIGGNSAGTGDAVVNVYINHEKKFAFVEMRTVEEASNAMALDGIVFEGVSVRVRRPTDYNPSLAAVLGPSQPSPHLNLAAAGLTPGITGETEGADRIFLGGVPYYLSETQIKELLESFGPLRGFDLVKDRETGNSKGYGFCIYKDPAATDIACAALNGLKMGDKTLTVRRATMSGHVKTDREDLLAQAQQHIAMQETAFGAGLMNLSGVESEVMITAETPSKVLCLTEVISTDELMNDGEYEEILEDMKEEGQKFGELIDVVIPRPIPNATLSHGLGKVFLEYSDTAGCSKARAALSGRKFGGNTVSAVYYPEDKYYDRDYAS
ncbi:splicing factor U2af large subunit B-like isoform X2 [Olea europaea var. sylvestris]|uniref:splicing factor U2af large subunit B-like isoform X2 n=1 Tax=Olea europaea var. sylvestris TaxID=158386 RepID=UPI000C1D8784|nr:splicing factor U2af large subunit B-like isoform X2 [Olea europaea var. sylvestris]